MDVAALIFSAAAVILAGLSALYARGSRDEAKRANDMTEEQIRLARSRERAALEAGRVQWVIERAGDSSYALRHVGTATVRGVVATTNFSIFTQGPLLPDQKNAIGADVMTPGQSLVFWMAGPSPYYGGGRELSITWEGQDDPVFVRLPEASPTPKGARGSGRPYGGVDI